MFDGVDGTVCTHNADLVPHEGDNGLWCPLCGLKIMAVETRPCGECKCFVSESEPMGTCPKLHLYISRRYFVKYGIKDRTCWEEKPKPLKKAMLKAGIADMKKIGKMLDDKK